jgi:hypothetical protein
MLVSSPPIAGRLHRQMKPRSSDRTRRADPLPVNPQAAVPPASQCKPTPEARPHATLSCPWPGHRLPGCDRRRHAHPSVWHHNASRTWGQDPMQREACPRLHPGFTPGPDPGPAPCSTRDCPLGRPRCDPHRHARLLSGVAFAGGTRGQDPMQREAYPGPDSAPAPSTGSARRLIGRHTSRFPPHRLMQQRTETKPSVQPILATSECIAVPDYRKPGASIISEPPPLSSHTRSCAA